MQEKQIAIVVAVIRNEAGDILLAKRNEPQTPEIHGQWEFVGGGINFGEDPVEAIKREVMEEIGVEVEVVRLLPKAISDIQNFKNGDKLQVIVLSFECKITSGIPKATDMEIAEVRFVPLNEVQNYKTFRNIHETVSILNS